MLFSAIPGQTRLKEQLIRGVQENRISHAQLFIGPPGSANLATALAYARYIQCTNRSAADSCGECASCLKFNKLIHPDLHFSFPTIGAKEVADHFIGSFREKLLQNPYLEIIDWMRELDAENKQANITAQECHEIIKKLSFKSFEGEYKIVLIWQPEFLGNEGNILLKLIEEPAPKTLILLVANNAEKLLATILSRVQQIKFNAFHDDEIAAYLEEWNTLEPDQARIIASLSEGNMNAALRLLDEAGWQGLENFRQWMLLCLKLNLPGLHSWVEEQTGTGRENLKNLLQLGLLYIRRSNIHRIGLDANLAPNEVNFVQGFSKFLNENNLFPMAEAFEHALFALERNGNQKIILFNLSLQIGDLLNNRHLNLSLPV